MSLFVARIKGFVRFKDLMGQLVSRDLKLKYRRDCIFKNVYESQYYELSGIFDEWPGYV